MPNRLLKESFKSSPQIGELSWFEQCVWTRLLVTVDDYGRFDGRSVVLKNELFPADEKVTKAAVEKAIKHLERVDLIRLYTVEDRPYLYIPTWSKHQQIRAKKSRFPSPDIIGYQMISNDIKCYRNPIQSNPIKNPILIQSNAHHEDEANEVDERKNDRLDWFEEWWSEYPRKVGKGKCRDKYLKIVTDEDKHAQLMAAIKKQNEVYKTKPVQYIPYPETWLNQERWEDELQPESERPKDKETDWSVFENWPAEK